LNGGTCGAILPSVYLCQLNHGCEWTDQPSLQLWPSRARLCHRTIKVQPIRIVAARECSTCQSLRHLWKDQTGQWSLPDLDWAMFTCGNLPFYLNPSNRKADVHSIEIKNPSYWIVSSRQELHWDDRKDRQRISSLLCRRPILIEQNVSILIQPVCWTKRRNFKLINAIQPHSRPPLQSLPPRTLLRAACMWCFH